MKKLLFLLISIIMVLCVGCGDTSEEKQVSFFEQYANSPVFSEKYQKYFVEKYCPESMEFNKKYKDVNDKVNKMINSKEYKMVSLNAEKVGGFTTAMLWKETSEQSGYYYTGPLKDGKPDGVGVICKKTDNDFFKIYMGEFKEGKFNGYGIQYNYAWMAPRYLNFPEEAYYNKITNLKTFLNNQRLVYKKDIQLKYGDSTRTPMQINDTLFDTINWNEKLNNYILYEGNFVDGQRAGKGIIYEYHDSVAYIDTGKDIETILKQRELMNKIPKLQNEIKSMEKTNYSFDRDTLAYSKNKLTEMQNELDAITSQYKNMKPKLTVSGRLFVMYGDFDDNKQDGEFVCYTQNETGGNGYKLFTCSVDEDVLDGDGKLWNDKGELVAEEASYKDITNYYVNLNRKAKIIMKEYDFTDFMKSNIFN